ncbi:MAG TPA: hypothetical protein VH164_03065 [Ktedonobacteraceae bacterium]|nr:hypothetical protein [Ktedonobacteraceae bacterium]
MRIIDEGVWQAQKAEIAAHPDAEYGQAFLEFCEDWCNAAEVLLGQTTEVTTDFGVDTFWTTNPIDALRDSLEPTQQAKGHILPGWLGQLLLVICSNWAFGGDQLFEAMNPLEQRFVGDAAFIINSEANRLADEVPDAPAR